MFGKWRSPSTVVKSAACQADEGRRPTVRSVPGPWRRIASNRRSVTFAATPSSFRARVRHASAGSGSSSRQMCAIVSQSRSYAFSASSCG